MVTVDHTDRTDDLLLGRSSTLSPRTAWSRERSTAVYGI